MQAIKRLQVIRVNNYLASIVDDIEGNCAITLRLQPHRPAYPASPFTIHPNHKKSSTHYINAARPGG